METTIILDSILRMEKKREATILSPHYPRKKRGSFLHKYKESHAPKGIKDP